MHTNLKATQAHHADADTGHAVDVEIGKLREVARSAKTAHSVFFYLLWATGMRVKDLSRLRGKQICAAEDCLEVEVRINKGRRKRALRALLRVPWEWLGGRPPYDIEHAINSFPDDIRPFEKYTATKTNNELKTMSPQVGSKKCTTYSFRRAYVEMIIKQCNGSMTMITSYTLHLTPTMVEGHYKKWKKVVPKRRSKKLKALESDAERSESESEE